MSNGQEKSIRFCRQVNAAFQILFSLFFFLIPAATVLVELNDPNLRSAGIPKSAWSLHRDLTPKYERWAAARLKSTRAAQLTTQNISGTEWPLFGSVFYLWATESLQDAWDREAHPTTIAPKVYAKGAIDAATRLVIDPTQANWVKIHWGNRYLTTEDVFYRMLVISALTSHARLTGDKEYLPMLKEQADGLSAEFGASRSGLLDDYPGECYPGDVLTAIAMIHRADKVLGTDHSAFVSRAIRGFQGNRADPRGLVPYSAYAPTGEPTAPSRGCGNSYVSLFSPEIWPGQAREWYAEYAHYYWQETWTCAGFREFPNDMPGQEWYVDVDAGPVLKGFGCAACAFGVGAARVNGHFEHAYPLTAELLVTSWPLPNGTRLLPRMLSNAADAPYLGEAGILFNLTRLPAAGASVTTGGSVPGFVWIFLTLQSGLGLLVLWAAVAAIRRDRKSRTLAATAAPRWQCGVWSGLMLAGLVCLVLDQTLAVVVLLMLAQLLPRQSKTKKNVVTEGEAGKAGGA